MASDLRAAPRNKSILQTLQNTSLHLRSLTPSNCSSSGPLDFSMPPIRGRKWLPAVWDQDCTVVRLPRKTVRTLGEPSSPGTSDRPGGRLGYSPRRHEWVAEDPGATQY